MRAFDRDRALRKRWPAKAHIYVYSSILGRSQEPILPMVTILASPKKTLVEYGRRSGE